MDNDEAREYAERTPVLRLVFVVHDGVVELSDVHQVDVRAPASSALDERSDVSGTWIEVRDSGGAPIFRHDLAPSLLDSAEVFPEDPYGEIVRVPTVPGTSVFSVLAPLAAGAELVVLVGGPTPDVRGPARELARIDARELRQRART